MNRSVISLGTNTTRLLVVREREDGGLEQLANRQMGTRLGEGLGERGTLAPAGVERTLEAVAEFVRIAQSFEASLASIATSAVRRADNAVEFAGRMRAVTGVRLMVLDGKTEAEASFLGATYGAAVDGVRVAVIDVGGGSTECAVGRDGTMEAARSIEIGSVRVAERYPELMGGSPGAPARAAALRARAELATALAAFAGLRPVGSVRSVAGTPLTIGAIAQGSHVDRVSGTILTRETLDAVIERLLDRSLDERRELAGMLPQRADVLAAGGLVLSEALRLLGPSEALLESNDLLLGFLRMGGDRLGE